MKGECQLSEPNFFSLPYVFVSAATLGAAADGVSGVIAVHLQSVRLQVVVLHHQPPLYLPN